MNPNSPGASPGDGGAEKEAEAAAAAAAVSSAAAHAPNAGGSGAGPEEEEQGDGKNHGRAHNHNHFGHLTENSDSPLAALNNVISANFRRALMASVLACAGLALTYAAGGVLRSPTTQAPVEFFQTHQGLGQTASIVGAVFFFGFGISAVRSATREILKTLPPSLGDQRKNGLRWFLMLVGYLVVIFGTLGALNVPVERLLVGGAVTGVILGIAAQQALGNIFAGLLLLITRPFAIGDEVSLRSGPMGGVLSGLVADMNLNYVKIVTDSGTVLVPNSSILSASIGPSGVFDHK